MPGPVPGGNGVVPLGGGLLAILVLAGVVYVPALGHEFQFDDVWKIVENPALLDPMSVVSALGEGVYSENAARFLPTMTFVLNRALFGLEPFGYHLTNLLFHLTNVCLVALVGAAVLRRFGQPSITVALLGAAIFAVHPLNSEAVNYCNARPNLIVTTFYLTTLWSALWATEPSLTGRGRVSWRWGVCALSMVGVVLSKELGITVVAMVPVMLLWTTKLSPGARGETLRRWGVPAAGLVSVGIAVFAFTGVLSSIFFNVIAQGNDRAGSWVLYLSATVLGQAEVFLRYLGLGLLPLPGFLNVDHSMVGSLQDRLFAAGGWSGAPWSILVVPAASAVILVLALLMIARLRRRYPFPTLCGLWLFVTHAPTSLMPRAEPMVEYRTYLPMVGFCLLAGWLLCRCGEALPATGWRNRSPHLLRYGVVGLLALLAFATSWRSQAWATQESLWTDSLSKAANNARAYNALGRVALERNALALATTHFRRALEIDPRFGDAHGNLGSALGQQGDAVGAVTALLDGAYYAPENAEIQNNLAILFVQRGEYDRATGHYDEAILLRPLFAEAHVNRGILRLLQSESEAAVADLRRAVTLGPEIVAAHIVLGDALVAGRQLAEAVDSYQRALTLDPDDVRVLNKLAAANRRLGQPRRAEELLRRVLEIDPTNQLATEALAAAPTR